MTPSDGAYPGDVTSQTMMQFADDPRTELDRKAAQLKWVAMAETIGYVLGFFCWKVVQNVALTKVTFWFHGWITVSLMVMVVWIYWSIDWRWYWIPLSLLPVLGGVLLFEKIRRDGAPPRSTPAFPAFTSWRNSLTQRKS